MENILDSTGKICELNEKQKAAIPKYQEMALKVALTADATLDENLVRKLTDEQRKLCSLEPAKTFLVFDSPMEAVKNVEGLSVSNCFYGQHDAPWLYYRLYWRKEAGLVAETDACVPMIELTNHVGWMWFGTTATIVTRRPSQLHFNTKEDPSFVRLHNPNGFAVEWQNGDGIYSLNGITIPEDLAWVIKTPADQLDVKKVTAIRNTEIRSEALKKIGVEKAMKALDPEVLDCDSISNKFFRNKTNGSTIPFKEELSSEELREMQDNGYDLIDRKSDYRLLQIEFTSEVDKRIYLEMVCPSSQKKHIEAVHPDCTTVKAALSWRNSGSISENYNSPLIHT